MTEPTYSISIRVHRDGFDWCAHVEEIDGFPGDHLPTNVDDSSLSALHLSTHQHGDTALEALNKVRHVVNDIFGES